MRSYRLRQFGRVLEAEEHAAPDPQGSEVLLRVVAAGVCHSDLHLWDGGYDLGKGKRLSVTDRGVKLPLTLGHEIVGQIVAVGPQVKTRSVDEKCLVFPWIGCGECRLCHSGSEIYCPQPRFLGILLDGGYADHVLVPHEQYLLPLQEQEVASAAPYACSGVTTFSALKKVGFDELRLDPVVLFGVGGLGLMSLGLLKAIGAAGAIVVDVDEAKLNAARQAGAIETILGTSSDVVQEIHAAIGGPPRAIIDFVGSEKTAATAFDALGKGGKLVMVGLYGGSAPWSLPLVAMKAMTIRGNYLGSLQELTELLALVRSEHIAPIPITNAPLESVNEVMNNLSQGKVLGRAILIP
jgi:propanol-preferring alcohol dehydrogenase